MRNYFQKRLSCVPLHTLSKVYDVPVSFVPHSHILRLCIALFAVAEGWLLFDIGWFALFLDMPIDLSRSFHVHSWPVNSFRISLSIKISKVQLLSLIESNAKRSSVRMCDYWLSSPELDVMLLLLCSVRCDWLVLLPSLDVDWSVGTVNFALPFTTNVTISISILQTFHSWVATSHLRPPMAFLYHNSSDTPGLAPLMNVLFWGRCDFPISFSGRDLSRNVWNRL